MATESGGCRALESGPFSAGSVSPSQVQTQLGQRQRVLVVGEASNPSLRQLVQT